MIQKQLNEETASVGNFSNGDQQPPPIDQWEDIAEKKEQQRQSIGPKSEGPARQPASDQWYK